MNAIMEPLRRPGHDGQVDPPGILSLRTVFLHLTKACNLRCEYCYFSANRPLPDEFSTAELSRLWPELVAVGPQKVVFTGGEPLLRPDILDLLRGLREADPVQRVLRCLNTNGHSVTPDLARDLVGLADEVRVSLDALGARNDVLRGRGNFNAAISALDCFLEAGFKPKVLVTVTSYTLPGLEALLCFLIEMGITRINLNPFRPVGRGRGHWEWEVSPSEVYRAAQAGWRRVFGDTNAPSVAPQLEPQCTCGVGSFLNVMPNGDVFPCHVLTQPEFRCGNLREQSLLQICSRIGLLGHLADLDFRDLARSNARLSSLVHPGTCLGSVYRSSRSLPIWGEKLPLTQRTADGPACGRGVGPARVPRISTIES